MSPVDLRSDTLTQPTAQMSAAMASAEVGDDVFREDPTINALEARCAELAGKEAALFVPSGTMANAIACKVHTEPGDEVIIESTSHLYRYEAAGYAVISGVSMALVPSERGLLDPAQVHDAMRPSDYHQPRTRLLWLEHTHNYGGGSCYPLADLDAVCAAGREHGLSVHLDGARVFNACVAHGVELHTVAQHVDTLNFCFSKGLGCPVGSVFIGSEELVTRARKVRKMLGGGMRQAGVLAAAALYALDHHVERLAEDHANAQFLAEGLAGVDGLRIKGGRVETNIVYFDTTQCAKSAHELCADLGAADVRCLPLSPTALRMVTHLDVDRAQVGHAVDVCRRVLGG